MTTWDELPHGTPDIRVAFAAELERMGIEPDELPECEQNDQCELDSRCPLISTCRVVVHDNGDYRA
jgi:hypothetical protein